MKLDFEVMVIIAGTLMNALKIVTTVSTMPIAMIPMVVLNVNVKRIGFYEQMIPNVDQMYALMVIMDMECIVNKCLIMLNARNCFQIHFRSVVNRPIFSGPSLGPNYQNLYQVR